MLIPSSWLSRVRTKGSAGHHTLDRYSHYSFQPPDFAAQLPFAGRLRVIEPGLGFLVRPKPCALALALSLLFPSPARRSPRLLLSFIFCLRFSCGTTAPGHVRACSEAVPNMKLSPTRACAGCESQVLNAGLTPAVPFLCIPLAETWAFFFFFCFKTTSGATGSDKAQRFEGRGLGSGVHRRPAAWLRAPVPAVNQRFGVSHGTVMCGSSRGLSREQSLQETA